MHIPTQDLRSNLGTWAVAPSQSPAVTRLLLDALPREPFDPGFRGQALRTTYFDTATFDLRRARQRGDKYLTLRVRCYAGELCETFALSAKTEASKFRTVLEPEIAAELLAGDLDIYWAKLLPIDLAARLLNLTGDRRLLPVVTVAARRYAVEDDADRLTLDVDVRTDTGKQLPGHVLEFKSTLKGAEPPAGFAVLGLRPIKMSKFLWATLWR
jgi:hypothetical protein